jgi:adenylate cyclase
MERAMEWGDRALAIAPDPSVLYNLSCMYARIGELEKALDAVEESARLGGGAVSRAWLQQDSDMDPLRDHPRFQAVLERLE